MTVTYPVVHGNQRSYGNFAAVETSDAEGGVVAREWVSYSTVIAFEGGNGWPLTTITNYWSNTTARHIITARQLSGAWSAEDWELGPLSADWFNVALIAFRSGGTIEEWLEVMAR